MNVNPGGNVSGRGAGGGANPGGTVRGLQPRRKHHKPVTHHAAKPGKGKHAGKGDQQPDTDDQKKKPTGKKPKPASKPKVIAPTITTRGLTGTAQALGLTEGYGDPYASGDQTGTAGIGQAYSDAVYGTGQSYAPEYYFQAMPQEQAAQSAIASPFGSKSSTGSTG